MTKIAYIAEKKIKKIKKPETCVHSAFRGKIVLKQPILLKKNLKIS